MTTSESNPPPQPKRYDPFSYPRLYPSGWDLEAAGANQDASPEQASAEEPPANPNAMPAWYEPFRDLRTFPSGWDLP